MKIAMIEDDGTISFAVSTFMKQYDMEVTILDSLASAEEIEVVHSSHQVVQIKASQVEHGNSMLLDGGIKTLTEHIEKKHGQA
jgi:two-component response regulator